MSRPDKHIYDAVIIGAGMSGLVCGCYLARAGMKVLIAERHHKPGGYCTSFKRMGFSFDAAPHCFGSYREEGITRKIFKDLEIDGKLAVTRPDPSDILITPDHEVAFWNDLEKTITEFRRNFPGEGDNIGKFFRLLINTAPDSFSRLRNATFKTLLDQYFTDERLKAILSFPFLGIGGLPPSMISAFIGAKLFSEFLFDGGYYPEGGMQALPEALSERFKAFGGELFLSCSVNKIRVRDNAVKGIVLKDRGFIPARYVVSNCDARQTFLKLLGRNKVEEGFSKRLRQMMPSISNVVLYLGIGGYPGSLPRPGTTFSFFRHYNIEKAYKAALEGDFKGYGGYMFRVSRDKSVIIAIIPAPYKKGTYWVNNKSEYMESLIGSLEKHSIADLSRHIVYKDAATPSTLHRYTLNDRGASFGWAGIPSQLAVPDLRKPSFIQGLYLTGHWTTLGTGISGVVYVGCDTAKIILRKERSNYRVKTDG